MDNNQKKIKCGSNKVRNQLIGFATFLLIIAIIAPNIITDKSNSQTSTVPLASPDIIDESFDPQITTSSEQTDKPYMIQLGALKNKKKIEELVALLRLNNYNVRVIPNNPGPNQLIKLQVGPYAKREQAEQLISNLNNLTKLKGVIITN